MWTKRILILLPIAVSVFLLQSYFWVPSYEKQAEITPDRLNQYVSALGGDAQILNPILNADTSSSAVTDQVFEGLIDRDKDLNWRGRVATSWEIRETAYLLVSPEGGRTPDQLADLIRAECVKQNAETSPLAESLRNITAVVTEPAATMTKTVSEPVGEDEQHPQFKDVKVTIRRPESVRLELASVDQDLFDRLAPVLGRDIVAPLRVALPGADQEIFDLLERVMGEEFLAPLPDAADRISVDPDEFSKNKDQYAETYLVTAEHNPVIVFHLRKGVRFQDGAELTSKDVKFTYDAIMRPKNLSPRVSDYEPVKSVETPDTYTVRVTYKRLFSPGFGSWGMGILPEHLLNDDMLRAEAEKKGKKLEDFSMRDCDFNLHPIGSGPFKFVRWLSDQYILMVRNDDYWEGPPAYKTYTLRILPDSVMREMEFYGGAVDSYNAQPHQVARLSKDERYQHFSGLSMGYTYIGYNMRRDIFKDKRVRQALGMAIDTDRIIKYVMYDQAERITGPFVKQTDFYDKNVAPLPCDPEGAKRLLAEAGWVPGKNGMLEKDGKPLTFTLLASNGSNILNAILAIAQDSWKKIGVDVKTETLEWSVFISKHVDIGDFDAVVLSWQMDIEPDLFQIWHSSQSGPCQLNFVAYNNPRADDLIVRIRKEYSHERQVEMCHELHRIIADDQPYTFLFVGKWTALLDKKIYVEVRDESGKVIGYRKITPTRTGDYGYYFKRWIKLPTQPELTPE